ETGAVLDFHALRVTLGTRLSDANVPLVRAQRIMRHSDPKLTANLYTKPASSDLRADLERAVGAGGVGDKVGTESDTRRSGPTRSDTEKRFRIASANRAAAIGERAVAGDSVSSVERSRALSRRAPRTTLNQRVVGSSPTAGTTSAARTRWQRGMRARGLT